VLGVHLPFQL